MNAIKKTAYKNVVIILEAPGFRKEYWIEQDILPDGSRTFRNRSRVIDVKTCSKVILPGNGLKH